MANYPTLDYLPDLDLNRMMTADTLSFVPYTLNNTTGWDNWASRSTVEPYASFHDTFRWTAIKGATYDIFSISYFDPFLVKVYDEFGNVIAVNTDSSYDTNGTDYVWSFVAPYSGTYYVSAGWNQPAPPNNQYVRITIYEDIGTIPASAKPYTMAGTQGDDYLVLAGNNQYFGGAGNDTYIISSYVLNGLVTASIVDTEGTNVIQFVPGSIVASNLFLDDAVQLTFTSGAKLQILGASKFTYQVGADATVGDIAPDLTFEQFKSLFVATDIDTMITGVIDNPFNHLVGY